MGRKTISLWHVYLLYYPYYFRLENTAEQAEELLKKPFFFIQTSDGKIVAVQHNLDEKISVANLKKGIAAAFQGNFKQTTEKVEEDTQSLHISQYR